MARELYRENFIVDPTGDANTFKEGKLTDVSLMDEECKTVLGKDWQVWEATDWEEWHWVFQIPGGVPFKKMHSLTLTPLQ